MAQTPKLSFDHVDCRGHLEKMNRGVDRLEEHSDRNDKSDFAIDAARDGWHLHEWVWNAIKIIERSDPEISDQLDDRTVQELWKQHKAKQRKLGEKRVEIGKKLGIKPSKVGKREFGIFMAQEHPAIELCRLIATGSKHISVDEVGDLFVDVEAYVSAPVSKPFEQGDDRDVIKVGFPGETKIRVGDTVYRAGDVFREAVQNWTDFIYGYGMDR